MSANPFSNADRNTNRGRADLALAGVAHRVRGVGTLNFTGSVSDGEVVTIEVQPGPEYSPVPGEALGTVTFEFDTDSDVADGNVAVDVSGDQSAAAASAALQAVMASELVGTAQTFLDGVVVLVVAAAPGTAGATLTTDGANITAEDVHGDTSHGSPQIVHQARGPVAEEVTQGAMYFAFDFLPMVNVTVNVLDPSLAEKAWDGAFSQLPASAVIKVDNSGSTDWAVGDTVLVKAEGPNVGFDTKQVLD